MNWENQTSHPYIINSFNDRKYNTIIQYTTNRAFECSSRIQPVIHWTVYLFASINLLEEINWILIWYIRINSAWVTFWWMNSQQASRFVACNFLFDCYPFHLVGLDICFVNEFQNLSFHSSDRFSELWLHDSHHLFFLLLSDSPLIHFDGTCAAVWISCDVLNGLYCVWMDV